MTAPDPALLRARRRALADIAERAIALLDAIDADHEDLEDCGEREAVDEDGDALDAGERDGWRRPRRARIARTERPRRVAARALQDLTAA